MYNIVLKFKKRCWNNYGEINQYYTLSNIILVYLQQKEMYYYIYYQKGNKIGEENLTFPIYNINNCVFEHFVFIRIYRQRKIFSVINHLQCIGFELYINDK